MRRPLAAIRMYLMLLFLAVFVVMPVAEALACAQESPTGVSDVHSLKSYPVSDSGKGNELAPGACR